MQRIQKNQCLVDVYGYLYLNNSFLKKNAIFFFWKRIKFIYLRIEF